MVFGVLVCGWNLVNKDVFRLVWMELVVVISVLYIVFCLF